MRSGLTRVQRTITWRLMLTGCVVIACIYSWYAVRAYRAHRFAANNDQASLKRAIALQPTDAEYYDLLGRNLLFVAQEPSSAATAFNKAIALNPYRSSYLLDLAQAYFGMGDQKENLAALRKAIAIDPKTLDVAWSAGNFFLVQGDVPEALQQFAIVLRNDPGLAAPVLSVCWRTLEDVRTIESILPPDPALHLEFVRLLISQGEITGANDAWSDLLQLHREFDYHQALFYVNRLIDAREVGLAREAWKQLVSTSSALARYTTSDNLLVNGAFSEDILNGGFDWRYVPSSTPSVALDPSEIHSSGRSLLISYSNSGTDSGVYQYVPVDPNTRYALAAWVKSEDLESANGPSVAALDAFDNTIYAQTDETIGTTSWHHVSKEFETGNATGLIVIRFVRNPGATGIRGRFWVDDVSLRPVRADR